MSLAHRLRRLESAAWEQDLLHAAERVARRFGLEPEEAVDRLVEIARRVERWGLDAELRRVAQDHGLSEDDARARFDEALAELEEER